MKIKFKPMLFSLLLLSAVFAQQTPVNDNPNEKTTVRIWGAAYLGMYTPLDRLKPILPDFQMNSLNFDVGTHLLNKWYLSFNFGINATDTIDSTGTMSWGIIPSSLYLSFYDKDNIIFMGRKLVVNGIIDYPVMNPMDVLSFIQVKNPFYSTPMDIVSQQTLGIGYTRIFHDDIYLGLGTFNTYNNFKLNDYSLDSMTLTLKYKPKDNIAINSIALQYGNYFTYNEDKKKLINKAFINHATLAMSFKLYRGPLDMLDLNNTEIYFDGSKVKAITSYLDYANMREVISSAMLIYGHILPKGMLRFVAGGGVKYLIPIKNTIGLFNTELVYSIKNFNVGTSYKYYHVNEKISKMLFIPKHKISVDFSYYFNEILVGQVNTLETDYGFSHGIRW